MNVPRLPALADAFIKELLGEDYEEDQLRVTAELIFYAGAQSVHHIIIQAEKLPPKVAQKVGEILSSDICTGFEEKRQEYQDLIDREEQPSSSIILHN